MIAVLSATWTEIEGVCNAITHDGVSGKNASLEYFTGKLNFYTVLIGITGVGIKRARSGTSYIIQQFKPDFIIYAGLCGALSPELKVSDIIVGTSVHSLRKASTIDLYAEIPHMEIDASMGAILTESRFIHRADEKKRVYENSQCLAVDMETWGVVEAALQSGIPVISIRSVSDGAHDNLPDMGAIYNSSGCLDKRKSASYFLSNPALISPYLKFRFINSKKAVRTLNDYLLALIPELADSSQKR